MRKLMLLPALAVVFAFTYSPAPAPANIYYLGLRGGGCREAPFIWDFAAEVDAGRGKWTHLHFLIERDDGRKWDFQYTGQGFYQIRRGLEVQEGQTFDLEARLYSAKKDGSVRFDKRLDSDTKRVVPCP